MAPCFYWKANLLVLLSGLVVVSVAIGEHELQIFDKFLRVLVVDGVKSVLDRAEIHRMLDDSVVIGSL